MASRYDWQEVTLGDFVTLQRGHDLPEQQRRKGSIPILGSFGITGWHDEPKAEGPGVTVGRSGASIGVVTYSSDDYWPLNTALYVKDFHGNNEHFAYYFLTTIDFKRYNSGSAQPSLNRNYVHPIPITIPPLPVQRAIAHILGSLDDKIELNRQMNRTLEKMAQAIFKSWFIDFDPVRAKAEGRDPGLPKEIADLFPDSFEDSDLGQIPTGWEVRSLDEIADFLNGLACQKYPAVDGEPSLPVIKIRELRQGISDNTDRATANTPSKHLVNDGDVLFSWSGSLLVDVWTGGQGLLNQHVFKVTSDEYPKWFFFYWTAHHLEEFQRIAADKATTMGHIKRHHLSDAKVAVPPQPVMVAATAQIAPLFDAKLENNIQSLKLSRLRDTLLPKLISGELPIPDAEKLLEGVE